MFDTAIVLTHLPDRLHGLGITILFTLGGFALGLVIGVLAAVLGLWRRHVFHWLVPRLTHS